MGLFSHILCALPRPRVKLPSGPEGIFEDLNLGTRKSEQICTNPLSMHPRDVGLEEEE